jgi:hypothetical protein
MMYRKEIEKILCLLTFGPPGIYSNITQRKRLDFSICIVDISLYSLFLPHNRSPDSFCHLTFFLPYFIIRQKGYMSITYVPHHRESSTIEYVVG